MIILFDHQTFSLQNYGGISRYYAELMSGINSRQTDRAKLPLLFSNNVYLKEKGIAAKPFFSSNAFEKREAFLYRLNKFYTITSLQRTRFDVLHPTYYDPYFLPYIKNKPFVVTFLDMIHEKFSHKFKELELDHVITNRKRVIANRASKIIAISENTKQDVIDLFGVSPSKVEVIYLANSLKIKPNSETNFSFDTRSPYLLYVGNRGHYKNFEGLIKSIHFVLIQNGLKLVCAGGGKFNNTEQALIHSLSIDNYVEHYSINDQSLVSLYSQATAFILPSFYEGFGIPVLEAFACDCPCLLSDSSSLPEIAGDAALYFNPGEPDSIVGAVETLLRNNDLRDELIRKGRQQLKHFSWKKTIDQTLDLYKTLL